MMVKAKSKYGEDIITKSRAQRHQVRPKQNELETSGLSVINERSNDDQSSAITTPRASYQKASDLACLSQSKASTPILSGLGFIDESRLKDEETLVGSFPMQVRLPDNDEVTLFAVKNSNVEGKNNDEFLLQFHRQRSQENDEMTLVPQVQETHDATCRPTEVHAANQNELCNISNSSVQINDERTANLSAYLGRQAELVDDNADNLEQSSLQNVGKIASDPSLVRHPENHQTLFASLRIDKGSKTDIRQSFNKTIRGWARFGGQKGDGQALKLSTKVPLETGKFFESPSRETPQTPSPAGNKAESGLRTDSPHRLFEESPISSRYAVKLRMLLPTFNLCLEV
jgi:hypothetical protein